MASIKHKELRAFLETAGYTGVVVIAFDGEYIESAAMGFDERSQDLADTIHDEFCEEAFNIYDQHEI